MANRKSPLEMARAATADARGAADLLRGATEDLTPRLSKLYTGVVHDVMRRMGMKDFTLPHTLHPTTVARTIAGPVFTVRGMDGRRIDTLAVDLHSVGDRRSKAREAQT